MLSTLLARFKEKKPEEEELKTAEKAASFTEFLHTPETKQFVNEWYSKKNPDNPKKPLFRKRGITNLLRALHKDPTYSTNKAILREADEALSLLSGMDKLEVFLSGLKAAPHGIMKALGLKG